MYELISSISGYLSLISRRFNDESYINVSYEDSIGNK